MVGRMGAAVPVSASTTRARALAQAGRWEMALAALCLVQCSEPLFAAVAQSQGLVDVPGYARAAWAPVYAFLGWAIWRDARRAGGAIAATPLLWSLVGFALLSSLWSIDAGATVRRVVWLVLSMTFGLYLAWRYEWRRLFEVFALAWIVMIVGSAVLSIATPAIGVATATHPGAWNGLWTHKNTMGGIMALGAPIGLAAYLATGRRVWAGVALAAFAMVLLSTSKTSLMGSVMGVGVIALGALARRGPMASLAVVTGIAVVGIAAGFFILLAPDTLVGLIGRDMTFTGRTDIWAASEHAVEAQPWLGYGYYAFWLNPDGPAYYVRQATEWMVPSAHNGWLELALGIGLIGVGLFIVQYLAAARRALGALADPVAGLWAPAFLAVFTLYTLSESHILEANNLFWTLYVTMTARLALDAKERAA